MSIADFKDLAEGVGVLLAATSVIAAALLFLWKREWRARLAFDLSIDAFARLGNNFIVEPACVLENKGLLRCYVHRLQMSVRALHSGDAPVFGDEKLLGATEFPHSVVKTELVKSEWEWSYVEAGTRVRYSHVAHVRDDTVALLVWVKLFHKKNVKDDFFTAQRVFVVVGDKLLPQASAAE